MSHDKIDIVKILSSKFSQHNTANYNALDFLHAFGSPIDALMYLSLFWPDCIEFEGMIFRHDVIESKEDHQRVREALAKNGGDKSRTEASFNIVDVPCMLFSHEAAESPDEVDQYLAEQLAEMWRCRLALIFPDRNITTEVIQPEDNNDEWGVTFYSSTDTI